MKCPKCNSESTRVTCTEHNDTFTKRYCRCLDCGLRFRTIETYQYKKPGPPKGKPRPGKIARGTAHGSAIFSEQNILDMRYLYESGKTLTEIAKRYGTSCGYVSKIVNRKAWTHI